MACQNCKRMNREIKNRINELHNSGYNINQIASMLGLHSQTIKAHLETPVEVVTPVVEVLPKTKKSKLNEEL